MRVLNLWQKNNVFKSEIIQPLLDMAAGIPPPAVTPVLASATAAMSNTPGALPGGARLPGVPLVLFWCSFMCDVTVWLQEHLSSGRVTEKKKWFEGIIKSTIIFECNSSLKIRELIFLILRNKYNELWEMVSVKFFLI